MSRIKEFCKTNKTGIIIGLITGLLSGLILSLIFNPLFYILAPKLDKYQLDSNADKIILSPEIEKIYCNGLTHSYHLKITNNDKKAIGWISIKISPNETKKGLYAADLVMEDSSLINGGIFISYNKPDGDEFQSLQFQTLDLNPFQTASFLLTVYTEDCEGEFELVTKISGYGEESYLPQEEIKPGINRF